MPSFLTLALVCALQLSPTFLFHWKNSAPLSSFFLNRDCVLHEIYNLPLDITPISLLKGFLDIVGPGVISTVNSSMATGAVASCFTHTMGLFLLKMTPFSEVSEPFPYFCFCSVWVVTTHCIWKSVWSQELAHLRQPFPDCWFWLCCSFPRRLQGCHQYGKSCHYNWLSWAWGWCEQHCPGLAHVITEKHNHLGIFHLPCLGSLMGSLRVQFQMNFSSALVCRTTESYYWDLHLLSLLCRQHPLVCPAKAHWSVQLKNSSWQYVNVNWLKTFFQEIKSKPQGFWNAYVYLSSSSKTNFDHVDSCAKP